jgi:hypothetical protein
MVGLSGLILHPIYEAMPLFCLFYKSTDKLPLAVVIMVLPVFCAKLESG